MFASLFACIYPWIRYNKSRKTEQMEVMDMGKNTSAYEGCFLGLAVGDAMGYIVDEMTWEQIQENYGPNGLLGYDLQNDYAEVSSYTQIAAYVANGLLLGVTRGRADERVKYISLALREWAKRQHFPRDPARSWCWVSQSPELRRRHCRDARMLDAMRFENLGTLEKPINNAYTPGSLTSAPVVGLFFDPNRMEPAQIGMLAAQTVALTHGSPEAFLPAVALAYSIAGILQEPERPLKEQFLQAAEVMDVQFRERFPEAAQIAAAIKVTVGLACADGENHRENMEKLHCSTGAECLQGAIYASLVSPEDFDAAMILAVNHSGRSAAVAAVTGAILGAKLGVEALPEFYLESLEPVAALRELAEDLAKGSPAAGLFDDDWDQKYTHGIPL